MRVAIGDWEHRNFCNRLGVFQVETLCARHGTNARCERIARVNRHIHHASPLHAVFVTHGAFGKDLILEISVIARIGVDNAAHGAMLGRHLGFDPAP